MAGSSNLDAPNFPLWDGGVGELQPVFTFSSFTRFRQRQLRCADEIIPAQFIMVPDLQTRPAG